MAPWENDWNEDQVNSKDDRLVHFGRPVNCDRPEAGQSNQKYSDCCGDASLDLRVFGANGAGGVPLDKAIVTRLEAESHEDVPIRPSWHQNPERSGV